LATALLLTVSCANLLGLEAAGSPEDNTAGAGVDLTGQDAGNGTGGSALAGGANTPGGGAVGAEGGGGDQAGATTNLEHGLYDLVTSSGVLEPKFSPEHHDYQLRLGVAVPYLTLTPATLSPSDATINDVVVPSGTASAPIVASFGKKTSITVTVLNGTPKPDVYEIEVERASGLFAEAYLKASNARPDDHFGASVALSQSTLAVGAPLEDGAGFGVDASQASNEGSNSGAVYVFVKSAEGWTQQAYLKASNPRPFDGFGAAVALSGDTLVVGAPAESSKAQSVDGEMDDTSAVASGAAYVFQRVAGHWAQRAYLKASDSNTGSQFGTSVGISGKSIVVGAPGHSQPQALDRAGAAYVFEQLGEKWAERQALAASSPGARDAFGTSVAISAERIVVGAPGESSSSTLINGTESDDSARSAGAAYVFFRDPAGWKHASYLKASNARADAYFGSAVAVDGELVAVGSPGESSSDAGVAAQQNDEEAPGSGAVYVFANGRKATSWQQTAYIKASNSALGDSFGSAVALGQGVLAVAASGSSGGEDSAATGINGKQSNEAAPQSGAVYLFANASGRWEQQAYVKASNTEAEDHFGGALAVADGDLAVGAELEDSYKADDSSDNTASASGAAYVRSLLALPPELGVGARGLTRLELADLSFDFSPSTLDYQLTAPADMASVLVNAVPADPGAEVSLTDLGGTLVDLTQAVELEPGDNRFTVHVLARSGEYVTYTVNVRRPLEITEETAEPSPFDVSAGQLWEAYSDSSLPVALSGDTLVVGVPYDDIAKNGASDEGLTKDTGAVYVFVRKGQAWEKQTTLKASNADVSNFFGMAVALDGDTLVVGASGEASPSQLVNGSQTQDPLHATQTGAAYVFVRTQGVWTQQAYLKAFNATAYDYFGEALAIDGDRVVVGARGEGSLAFGVDDDPTPGAASSGAAYTFVRTGNDWSAEAYLKASNTHEAQWFGTRVALLGNTIAVTATDESGGSSIVNGDQYLPGEAYGGAVYTFVLQGGHWHSEAYVKPPNYHVDLDFGRSLALGTNTLVVGATGDQSRSRYVNGDEFDAVGGNWVTYNQDSSISGHGAVYVFERDVNRGWHESAYLKASNSDAQDAFGKSVSLFGDYLAVGAPGESAGGLDADDNAAQGSGAAYLFYRSTSGWSQASYIKPASGASGVGFGCSVAVDPLGSQRLGVGNCRQQSPEEFNAKTFGRAAVFQF
jgi:hypothetical protein